MDDQFSFLLDDDQAEEQAPQKVYKVVIADDDEEVHRVTRLMLRDFEFEGHRLVFVNTYSGKETIAAMAEHRDAAVLLLDVVMESSQAGLEVVNAIRYDQNNRMTRIILRTGQPGEAPEDRIIVEYDINDYRLKTDMTLQRLKASMYEALRSYRDLQRIEQNRLGLEKIIRASADLFQHETIRDFFASILDSLTSFDEESSTIIFRGREARHAFVYIDEPYEGLVIAATGKYSGMVGASLSETLILQQLIEETKRTSNVEDNVYYLPDGFMIVTESSDGVRNYIYIEGNPRNYDLKLIKIFLSNYSLALERFQLHQRIMETQKKIIFTLGEVIERRSKETANHVHRVAEMAAILFARTGFSRHEQEVLKIASTMHDIGKIGIPDSILLKKGKLTDEEFDVMKSHTLIADEILNTSELELIKRAAMMAKYHHEKYDGSGYPTGLIGEEIPLEARILAIVDVFDAITHKRIYKDAWPLDEAIAYMIEQRGKHFDPVLIDYFMEEIDAMKAILAAYPD